MQDAPASITSISDDTLRAASLDSANDLARAVPSLTITDAGPGQRRITLRGIRSAGDAQVGIYYDETPVAGPPGTTSDPGGSQSDFKLFDLERVEVLRGPQGTLYGAGAVGGTIRLVTRKPDFEFGGRIDVGATTTEGGGEGYQINAAVNVPIVKDVLAVRGVYFRRQNRRLGGQSGAGADGINSERSDGGRILVRFIRRRGSPSMVRRTSSTPRAEPAPGRRARANTMPSTPRRCPTRTSSGSTACPPTPNWALPTLSRRPAIRTATRW
ncbi:TonB-dependent receptor plug domain-containing protein [Novosphingobium resinovorum]|uniref:TonB-dependent receptor plug domain-containing protein n=1 Tax=Novosphingobium resinovorum TaxID=158500 RepID=UPI003D2CFAFC